MPHDPQPNIAKLVRMANQIATFFASQPGQDGAGKVAAHLNDFWSPDMRAALAAHVAQGGAGLVPLARDCTAYLRLPEQSSRGG